MNHRSQQRGGPQGPVQKKMWGPHFSWKKTGDLFCPSLSFHSGVAHFSRDRPFFGMQKFAAPFVGAPFCGAPVRSNMLNMPKSAAGSPSLFDKHSSFLLVYNLSVANLSNA